MMAQRDDAEEIKQRLNQDLEGVLTHFWRGWMKRGKIAYCAPKNKHDLGSFQVYLVGHGKYSRGSWVRSSAGIGGDELNLFAYGLTRQPHATAEVFQKAREFVGMADAREETAEDIERREKFRREAAEKRRQQAETEARAALRKAATVAEICREARPIDGTPAARYLLNRGVPKPPSGWPDSILFHAGLEWELGAEFDRDGRKVKDGPTFAALVARVENVAQETTAIWRIFVTDEGKKAPVSNPKLGLGPAAGGAVRLGGSGKIVGAGEGLESSFGAWSLIGWRHPVWACLSTSGMMNLELPLEIEEMPIFMDGDKPWKKENGVLVPAEPAGRHAANVLKRRCEEVGVFAPLQREPPIKKDYLNVWNTWQQFEEVK